MSRKIFRLVSTAALACASVSLPALAQLSPQAGVSDAPAEGEIVVTAQKREQNVQSIGLSVSALGGEALAAMGRQDVTALAGQIPSLQVNQYSPTVTVFNIRGVSQNDFADSQEAPIAFYNDEVYISALGAISGMTFDLQRVEVLRGPQGTLFGRNATGGLVQIISAKPTRELEAFVTGTVGSYGQIATEGAISGPLSDSLAARLSFTTNNGGGYIRNRVGSDLGSAKFYAGRLQLAGDVGSSGKFNLKAQILRNDHDRQAGLYSHASANPNAQGLGQFTGANENPYGNCNGCDALGYVEPDNNPFTASFNGPNYFDRTFVSATGRYEQDLGGVTLTSITDFQHLKKGYGEDSDMSPVRGFEYTTAQRLHQWSQELRLAGNSDRVHWIVGMYGINIHTANKYDTDLSQSFGLNEIYSSVLNTNSVAGFGQLEYKLSDEISLIGGARYSEDWKHYDYVHSENGVQDFVFNRTNNPGVANKRFGNYSGKIEIDYKPTPDVFFYASINRGTKSGGFGTPAFAGPPAAQPLNASDIPFDQEALTNYEAGLKLTLFDRTTHFNISAFHYDYHNYQSFETVGVSLFVRNKQAFVNGVEFELNTRPVDGLYLSSFLTVLDSKIRNVKLPSGEVSDRRMPQAPKLSVGGNARYEFDAGPGKLALQTDWKYDSGQFFSSFNAPVDFERARVIGNARISYAFENKPFEVAAFVNNLTDREYRVYNLDLSGPFGFTQQTYGRPRWFGGSVTVRLK
jgi:iron complex outermembrane receptor protein